MYKLVNLFSPWFIVLFVLFTQSRSVNAITKIYQASFANTTWEVSSSNLECSLTHIIPEYGKINFSQAAGEEELATLLVQYNRGVLYSRGEISFASPSWRQKLNNKNSWKFQFGESRNPVIFSGRQARQLLDGLDTGYQLQITHEDNTNRLEEITAIIMPVKFGTAYAEYNQCQAKLLPVNFTELQRSEVYFETGSTRLDPPTTKWLDYIVAYGQDPATRRIELSGHTDSVGSFRANHKLASDRVERVRDYLISQGLSNDLIKLKVYGEQRTEYSNKSSQGRAKNRRVAIRIYR